MTDCLPDVRFTHRSRDKVESKAQQRITTEYSCWTHCGSTLFASPGAGMIPVPASVTPTVHASRSGGNCLGAGRSAGRSREITMDGSTLIGLLALIAGLLAVIAAAVFWPNPLDSRPTDKGADSGGDPTDR